MFLCTKCKNIDKFDLFPSENYKGEGNISYMFEKNGEIKISADDYTFIPDLDFMNEHAVCSYCGSTYSWEYSK